MSASNLADAFNGVAVRLTEGLAGLFAVIKAIKWFWPKLKRFLHMPDMIEQLSHQSEANMARALEQLSNRIFLLDGRNKLVSNTLNIPFLELNEVGVCDYVSAHAAELLGRSREDCLGNNWWNAIWPTKDEIERDRIRDRWLHSLERGELFEEDVRIFRSAGASRVASIVGLRVIPIRNPTGLLLGWKGLLLPLRPSDPHDYEVGRLSTTTS